MIQLVTFSYLHQIAKDVKVIYLVHQTPRAICSKLPRRMRLVKNDWLFVFLSKDVKNLFEAIQIWHYDYRRISGYRDYYKSFFTAEIFVTL